MDQEEEKYFKKMSDYNSKNVKGYYMCMIQSISQEALSGEKDTIKAKREISELLIDIEDSGGF
jgi:hypothetical protein